MPIPSPRAAAAAACGLAVGLLLAHAGGLARGARHPTCPDPPTCALGAGVIGVLVYVGLLVIGVDYPLVLALVAVLGELVPVLGPFIAGVPALVVAALTRPRRLSSCSCSTSPSNSSRATS